MRLPAIVLLAASFLVAGCAPSAGPTLEHHLENPLFGYVYYVEMTQHLTNLQINEDPMLEDEAFKTRLEDLKADAMRRMQAEDARIKEGRIGTFVRASDPVAGQVLVLDGMLYLSPDFVSPPGSRVRVYLSTVVDPRDAAFPDPTAVEVGLLTSNHGDQAFRLPKLENPEQYRTVIIHDEGLQRTLGFAQLREA